MKTKGGRKVLAARRKKGRHRLTPEYAGKRRSSSHFTVFFRANELPQSRFGFSIKKALGGAVVRNRIRRRLREAVRCHRLEIPTGWDIVIHPKSSVARAEFVALTADLLRLLKSA